MKAEDTALAAELVTALKAIPKVRAGLHAKPRYCDGCALELSAAQMRDGEGQGASHYFYVPRELAGPILDAAETVLREKLKALGVEDA